MDLHYKPRVIVWQLFDGNDLGDAEAFAEWMKNPQQVNTSLKQRYLSNSLLNEWLPDYSPQSITVSPW